MTQPQFLFLYHHIQRFLKVIYDCIIHLLVYYLLVELSLETFIKENGGKKIQNSVN